MPVAPYNPLDKTNLGKSVAEALLKERVLPLGKLGTMAGAGVYAIYYSGDFKPYAPIAARNRGEAYGQPIYVGKAVPKGSRKGGIGKDASIGSSMRDRLRIHATSINEVQNLDLSDFFCRAITVDDIWIPLGENMMIEMFKPIWNVIIEGFGNKVPGARRPQNRSRWDVLHPGRRQTINLAQNPESREKILERLNKYFAGLPVEQLLEDDDGETSDI